MAFLVDGVLDEAAALSDLIQFELERGRPPRFGRPSESSTTAR